jgi:sarcosine oxidase, subunit gamma
MADTKRASALRQHWIGVVPARVRSDAVSIEEAPFLGKILLQCDAGNRSILDTVGKALGFPLPRMPNTSVQKEFLCLWMSPSSWLFVTEPGEQDTLFETVSGAVKDLDVAVSDMTDAYTTIRIGGPRLPDILAKGCAVDLMAKILEPRAVVRTLMADVPVIFYHEESGAYYDIHVGGFDADYLWTWLIDAAREYTAM